MRVAIALSCLLASAVVAQALPVSVAQSGYLLDGSDLPVDGARDLVATLYDAPTGGAVVWSRSYPATSIARGYYALALGGAGSVGGVLDASHFAANGGALYLLVNVAGVDLLPRQAVSAAPVAAYALDAASVGGTPLAQLATAAALSSLSTSVATTYATKAALTASESTAAATYATKAEIASTQAAATSASATANDVAAVLATFDGVTRPCAGGGTQSYVAATRTWGACPATWTCATTPSHAGCVSGSTYASCQAIKADTTFTGGDGLYYIDPDGAAGAGGPLLAYCLMSKGGGGWTLALNVDTGDAHYVYWGITAFWTSTTTGYGAIGAHLTSDFKSLDVFKNSQASQVLVMVHEEGAMRAWKSWVLATPNTPSAFWASATNTLLTTTTIASEGDLTLDQYEPIVRPAGQLLVNRQFGYSTSYDRARLGNNQSWGFTGFTSNNADNVLDGLGLDMDVNNGAPGSWWDAGYGFDNASYTKALMGSDELPGDPWATSNSRGLHYDYAIFVR